MKQAVILAGGQGTRLRAAVADVPKPLAPIGGRPFLAYLLERLAGQGVREVVIAAGYRGEQVKAAFGKRFGSIALEYEIESEPLGTGGALRNALARVDFPVLALNGDTYAEIGVGAMLRAHEAAGAALTMAVRRMAKPDRYGAVSVSGDRVTGFAASSASTSLINCGIYLFAENLLAGAALSPVFSFEKEFLEPRVATLRPLAFEIEGHFIDIGLPADYERAKVALPEWHGAAEGGRAPRKAV